jgi:hypothetical protein
MAMVWGRKRVIVRGHARLGNGLQLSRVLDRRHTTVLRATLGVTAVGVALRVSVQEIALLVGMQQLKHRLDPPQTTARRARLASMVLAALQLACVQATVHWVVTPKLILQLVQQLLTVSHVI